MAMNEPMKRVVRTPTTSELALLNERTAAWAPEVAELSDVDLNARTVAQFREMGGRNGEEAVLGFLEYWAARIRDAIASGSDHAH